MLRRQIPLAVSADELDQDVVERERSILIEQTRESGKPEEIVQKMVEGRMRKFFEEVVLLSQTFVIDGENTVEKAIKAAEADIGAPVKLVGFVRMGIGEGMRRRKMTSLPKSPRGSRQLSRDDRSRIGFGRVHCCASDDPPNGGSLFR